MVKTLKNKTIKVAGIGAFISAVLASICCLGPLLLAALGLGGLGLAAGIAQYRPLLLILTAVILGTAFYFAYRKREVACEDGSCHLSSGSKSMKSALWAIAFVTIGVTTFPSWSTLLFRSSTTQAVHADHKEISLAISGMHCSACAVSIEKAVKKIDGIQSVSVDFDKSEALVIVDKGESPNQEIIEAVQSAGPYTAKIKG